jgi:hypothetical protein
MLLRRLSRRTPSRRTPSRRTPSRRTLSRRTLSRRTLSRRTPLPTSLLLAGLLSGCGFGHRLARLPAPIQAVTEAQDDDSLAVVGYLHRDGEMEAYAPEPYRGPEWVLPMIVDRRGTIVVWPLPEGVTMRVFVAHAGLNPSNFSEVRVLRGARDRELVDELRPLPGTTPLEGPTSIAVADLANVYNGRPLRHDDLVLIELSDGSKVQQSLFQNRRVGPHVRVGSELLVRTPLQPSSQDAALSPAMTLGLQLGYRSANRSSNLAISLDRLSLVGSLGVGTTALEDALAQSDVNGSVGGVLVAGLGGGGIKVADLLSVQVLGNLDAIGSKNEPDWALAFGLDLSKLASQTRYVGARLFRPNTLSEAPELPEVPPFEVGDGG